MPEFLTLRNSEASDWKRCPQKWQWKWNDRLTVNNHNPNLWFGTGWHLVMAHYYGYKGTRRGRTPLKVWRNYVREETVMMKTGSAAEPIDALTLGEAMIGHYIDHYQGDPHIHVIATEQTGEVLTNRSRRYGGTQKVKFVFTLDLLYRNLKNGKPEILDHKTASQVNTGYLALDSQKGSYLTFGTTSMRDKKLIKDDETIDTMVYNFVRKAMPDARPTNTEGQRLNKNGTVSKIQPQGYFHREIVTCTTDEMHSQVKRIGETAAVMERMKSGDLPIWKNDTRDCPGCEFFTMCVLHEQQEDWEDYRDAMYVKHDPYEVYKYG